MQSVEERLFALEQKVRELSDAAASPSVNEPWWQRHVGAFRDDPMFVEAERLGAEYRKSQPNPVDNPEAICF